MKKFIAYFDYLGFKQFIENNDLNYQMKIMANNFRDMELALGKGELKHGKNGVIADLANSKINCINFSDTIVFWTNDDSESSLIEIIEVAYKFNWQAILMTFPVRGSLVYDEIVHVSHEEYNSAGGMYNINSVFGNGLVKAYEKAEAQVRKYNIEEFLKPYAKHFKVPYKNGIELPDEFVMNIIEGDLNDLALKNSGDGIISNFERHNKSTENQRVKEKIDNTLIFLESFYNPNSNS